MNTDPQFAAAAASDAYKDRSQSDVKKQRPILLNDGEYTVFAYKADPGSGFHGAAYQNKKTHEIIIAYRGTDPDIKGHARTMLQDVAADFVMVRDQLNPQKAAADAFTQEVLAKAEKSGLSKGQIIVAGHSLGGSLAEIEASKFGLCGVTFNSYGATDLNYGITEGGNKVVNYVMAGDPVSAASGHYGRVVALASDQDIANLRGSRYLDAHTGAIAPNPLLAMSLGDHSVTWFTGPNSVLKPENMAQAMRNYAQSRAAIDHFRGDVYDSRAELAVALNSTEHLNLESTYAHLSPRMQQQLVEYHASLVDSSIQDALEHNRVVDGATDALEQGSVLFQAGGQYVQRGADQLADGIRSTGHVVQQRADEASRIAWAAAPLDPGVAGGVALGAKAVGFAAHVEAEGLAQTSHLAGQAAHATGQFVAGLGQELKHGVEQGVHVYASAVQSRVHQAEAALVHRIDSSIENHARLGEMVDAVGHAYSDAKRTMSHGMDAAERAAGEAYDTLSHSGRWFGDVPAASRPTESVPDQVRAVVPTDPAHEVSDPRHPDSTNHALYNELHRRIPDASEARLLQFTAACHAHEITANNLQQVHFDRAGGQMLFRGSGMLATPASVDVRVPSPQPQQSILQIQQHDQQPQIAGWVPSQSAAIQQGPGLAGR
ncbi:MAG TPA: Mbeg1-like protein [Rhodanobacter sp.]|nr:Mbeg1-like protein [Rhodanobacter sp.]